MPFTTGTKLGPYAIVAPLGAGGMGEVYRARDTRLDRDLAIKVLPETFAGDPERIARFQRKAGTIGLGAETRSGTTTKLRARNRWRGVYRRGEQRPQRLR